MTLACLFTDTIGEAGGASEAVHVVCASSFMLNLCVRDCAGPWPDEPLFSYWDAHCSTDYGPPRADGRHTSTSKPGARMALLLQHSLPRMLQMCAQL